MFYLDYIHFIRPSIPEIKYFTIKNVLCTCEVLKMQSSTNENVLTEIQIF